MSVPYATWNGHRLFYRERGVGPLLLVFPGNTASSASHAGELDHLSERYHAVAVDYLGTGQSDRVQVWAAKWWEQGARQAAALVSHLGHADCIAMGTSGGAVVALLMAILYPMRVRAVIADSVAACFSEEMLQRNVIADRSRRTPEQVLFWKNAHGADWEQVVNADTEMLQRFVEGGGDWFAGRLNEIQCPVLLTASRQDPFLPEVGRQACSMAEKIGDCRVFLDSEGDHPLMWSRPQDFWAVCDRFLATIEGRVDGQPG
jgi:valacyclovir hydrolase